MKPKFIFLVLFTLSNPALGKEGFSISLGIGGGFWSLDEGSLSSSLEEVGRPPNDSRNLTSTLDDGLALRFSMAYNIRKYVTIEVGITGHGWNLGQEAIGGSGHTGLVVHFHPLELFLPQRDYDATIFLGGGYSIMGGGQENDDFDRGMDGGMFDCGLTGRYYINPWLSLGAEFRFTVPFYQRWFVDWDNDVTYSLDTSPDALFFSMLVLTTFHFQAVNSG